MAGGPRRFTGAERMVSDMTQLPERSSDSGTSAAAPRAPRLEWVYGQPVLIRVVVLWLATFAVLFASFALHLWLGDGYEGEATGPTDAESVGEVLAVALPINLGMLAFIGASSTLFRFGPLNPGTLVIFILAFTIGRVAGLNDFEYPMSSVGAGLVRFAQVGLWEVSAYVLVAAVTMTKSRWIADRVGAKRWRTERRWRDLEWTSSEVACFGVAVVLIVVAAVAEGLLLARSP